MYLLDTNVVSELRKPKPHGGVLAWLKSVSDRDLHLSAVSLGEIQAAIELTREQDAAKAADIEGWADQVAATWNILPMDAATFRIWAKLMHRPSDTLIADARDSASAPGIPGPIVDVAANETTGPWRRAGRSPRTTLGR